MPEKRDGRRNASEREAQRIAEAMNMQELISA
jgi:hypothetical protein